MTELFFRIFVFEVNIIDDMANYSPVEFINIRSTDAFKKETGVCTIYFATNIDKNGCKVRYKNTENPAVFIVNENNKQLGICSMDVAEEILYNKSIPEHLAIGDLPKPNGAIKNVLFHLEICPSDRQFSSVSHVYFDKMRRVYEKRGDGQELVGIAKRDGKILVQPVFLEIGIYEWKVGLAPAQFQDGKWGYINYIGQTVIKPVFEFAQTFDRSSLSAEVQLENGETRWIDKDGKLYNAPLDFQSDIVDNFSEEPVLSQWEEDLLEAFEGEPDAMWGILD